MDLYDIDFQQIIKYSPAGIYRCDAQGVILFYNKSAASIWGRDPQLGVDQWCGAYRLYASDGSFISYEDHPMQILLSGQQAEKNQYVLIAERPDGSRTRLIFSVNITLDDQKNITGAVATMVDIGILTSGEGKDAILSAIVNSSDDAIISKDLNGIILSWNAAARRIFGYSAEETVGKHISILIPEYLQSEEEVIIDNIRQGRTVEHFQTVRMHKNGSLIPISLTVSPLKDSLGNVTGASKIARDISDRVNADEIIQQATRKLEILNAIGKTISEKLDVQEILQKVTDATTNLTGAAFGAFFYNTIDEHGESFMLYALSGAPREAFDKFGMPRNTAVFDPTFSGRCTVRVDDITKDPRYGHNAPHKGMPKGHLPVVSYMAVPVISKSGRVIGGLFFGHPQTGIFKKEHEDLIESIASQAAVALDNSILFEEIQALSKKKDEFMALASHELKTPLTSMKGYLQILERIVEDRLGATYLGKLLRQLKKLELLVNDLFDIAKIESGKLTLSYESFDLKLLVAETMEDMKHNAGNRQITLTSLQSLVLEADKHRIEQVLTNLLGNAIKYSPDGGNIHINLDKSGDKAVIKIRDEGKGMSSEQLAKIFDRFYRAENAVGTSGLGLGLYLSKDIIDRHGGSMSAESVIGNGSEFIVHIPLSKQQTF